MCVHGYSKQKGKVRAKNSVVQEHKCFSELVVPGYVLCLCVVQVQKLKVEINKNSKNKF